MITVEQRIRMIILLEKMTKQKSFSEKLGIKDISKFHQCARKVFTIFRFSAIMSL